MAIFADMPALPLLPEHREHATRDGEAAEHVDRGERERGDRKTEDQRRRPPSVPAPSGGATWISAPTAMMLEIALVTLISGVCSAGVTFQITM